MHELEDLLEQLASALHSNNLENSRAFMLGIDQFFADRGNLPESEFNLYSSMILDEGYPNNLIGSFSRFLSQSNVSKALVDLLRFLSRFITRMGNDEKSKFFVKRFFFECFRASRAPIPNPVKTAAYSAMIHTLNVVNIAKDQLPMEPTAMIES